ncbi:MAG TPA: pitrilysin family protein [Gemmatimonadales bacterium]|nr:pitrilysin family protein [Gemmatimonadales bacterium]
MTRLRFRAFEAGRGRPASWHPTLLAGCGRPASGRLALLAILAAPVSAQVTTAPPLDPAPRLALPSVDTARLSNGLTILISRNAEVPLITANLLIDGGTRAEGELSGLATFTAGMLDEGAGGRTGLELAEAAEFLGASLRTVGTWEMTQISVSGPRRTFGDAMALMADVVLRPGFAASDIARERSLRQAALVTARDNPSAVANRVFYRNVFPAGHPYHQSATGDSASTARLDSAVVRNFWDRAADPRKATLVITGDVTPAEARVWAEQQLGDWRSPASPLPKPKAATVATPAGSPTRVILVDKPDAPQSVIMIGAPGVDRESPDYAALQLLNTVLGGSFSARLNDILREQRGYTYGAFSSWSYSPVPGPFIASASVRTDVTDSSLAIFFHEFDRIRNLPVDEAELERARNYLVLGSLDSYETAGQVAGAIATGVLFDRSLSQEAEDLAAIGRVTAAQVQQAARKYLDPSHLTVVVVGDIARIRAGIEKLELGPVEVQKM